VNETELDVTFSKVEESLQVALEQHVGVVKQEQQQWLSAASEKVTWCADVSGDKYRCGHMTSRDVLVEHTVNF